MTQIELFAGIGGFGLAGHWAGIETVCQVEIDPFCQKVLQKNFPHAHRHDDIHTFDGTQYAGAIDIISGGFPCQPYSTAGKRLGKEDERHLWPEMLRVIRQARPRWVVGENVGGLISWSGGLVFEEVCAGLEAIGYEVQPFVLPACAVDAPHRRDRVWFVAHSTRPDDRRNAGEFSAQDGRSEQYNIPAPVSADEIRHASSADIQRWWREAGGENRPQTCNSRATTPHAHSARRQERHASTVANWPGFDARNVSGLWEKWTSEPPICGMDDGIPAGLDKHRNKRLKALGNAIVPQVAYQIFKSIVEYEHLHRR